MAKQKSIKFKRLDDLELELEDDAQPTPQKAHADITITIDEKPINNAQNGEIATLQPFTQDQTQNALIIQTPQKPMQTSAVSANQINNLPIPQINQEQ